MDDTRFDAITRALATPSRRRGMLGIAAGSALGLLGLSAVQDGAAQERVGCEDDKDCAGRKVCGKRNICVQCEQNADCRKGKKCRQNECVKRN